MSELQKLPLPLKGIRILDATHIVAGPFCSLILADMGAEVIKIERPKTGDLARDRGPFIKNHTGEQVSSRYLGINRNKKSVTLDLRNPKCKTAFEKLVASSDVLLDNWGPGAFHRLGLGYDSLKSINTELIYATITGYGDSEQLRGPYSKWPANNLSIQGMSGWMELTGDPEGPPQSVGDNIGDSIPGLWTALGIVLALETRRQTGVGQHLDMGMYECMVTHTISNMNSYQVDGQNPGRSWDRMASAGLTFKAKDGYVVMAGVRLEERWRKLWLLADREDLLEDPRYLGHGGDGEFYFNHVIPAIEGWSRKYPSWEVVDKLTDIGFSMGIAQTISDLDKCQHLKARDMFVTTDDTIGGQFKSIKTPIRLTSCEDVPVINPPRLGQNNHDILTTLGGLTLEEIRELEAEGAI